MLKVYKGGATWCGPCRMVDPIIEELKQNYPDVDIISFDVDNDPALAETFNIRNIPAVIFVKGNREVERVVGAKPYAVYSSLINSYK